MSEKQLHNLYVIGGIFTVAGLVGILLDVIIGNITGGNLTELPQSAVSRFTQFNSNYWLGLYNLDLLNIVNQLLLIPGYVALFYLLRNPYAALALVVFLVGTVVFVTTNTALPMLELSRKFSVASEADKVLFAAAGEAMLSRAAHGSLGAFIGFVLPNVAGMIMSAAMLSSNLFNKYTGYLGFIGSALMILYVVLVTFVPEMRTVATMIAMPGGLMVMTWMVLFTVKFLKPSKSNSTLTFQ
jgi:hypothetical protein